MDISKTRGSVETLWNESIVPQLVEYIRMPNLSPLFDPDWEAHGDMEAAARLMQRWADRHAPAGSTVELLRLPGRVVQIA